MFLVILLGILTIPDWFFSNKNTSSAQYITITELKPSQDFLVKEKKEETITQAKILPSSVTIAAPFFPQAPDNKWTMPRAEACSEANLVLAAYYIKEEMLSKKQFKKEIIDLTKLQTESFWTYIEIPLAELKSVYDTYYPNLGSSRIRENPSIDDIKNELAQGHLVIVPTAGKKLNNPHFFGQWPRFHTILLRWYDDTYFYTNEVWMMHGENFKYTQEIVINAIHDLVDGDITQWAKRVLVISK